MRAKKIHKEQITKTHLAGINFTALRPICKVDNSTFSYTASQEWDQVNCMKCLKEKPQATANG